MSIDPRIQDEADRIATTNGFTCLRIQDAPYLKYLGCYVSNGCIAINVDKCERERVPVRRVMLHEMGHRWHAAHPQRKAITAAFVLLAPVSSYAPSAEEKVAEAFCLFMMGTLPSRHENVLRTFGLQEPLDAHVCDSTLACRLDSI